MAIALPLALLGLALIGQTQPLPPIIPQPQEYVRKSGQFELLPTTVIVAGVEERAEAEKLALMLRRATGYPILLQSSRPVKDYIEFDAKPELRWLGAEGYRVSVRPGFVLIRSFAAEGLFHGIQTFRQLMPIEVESAEPVFTSWKVPAVEISDTPRFPWRGMHLDESRHFFGKDAVKKYIDLMSLYKFNRFHWHLVDDGGWRLEIPRYPDLTRVGAWRLGDGHGYDHATLSFNPNDGVYQVYGGFYTHEDVREIVAYAAERHVDIVPEIEMPSHSLPALWAYRVLACDSDSVRRVLPALRTQFVNTYCPGKQETWTFIHAVLDEVCALFPGSKIHIGGDEHDLRTWADCRYCLELRNRHGLDNPESEYSWFMGQVAGYLRSKGKEPVAWDEAIGFGPIPGLTVMSWRGDSGAVKAAKSGQPAIVAPQEFAYFDRSEAVTSTAKVYGFDPMPKSLNAIQQKSILGGQGQIWTERLMDWPSVERAAIPRMLALSESLWTEPKNKNWNRFSTGLPVADKRLRALGMKGHSAGDEVGPLMFSLPDRDSSEPPSRADNHRPNVEDPDQILDPQPPTSDTAATRAMACLEDRPSWPFGFFILWKGLRRDNRQAPCDIEDETPHGDFKGRAIMSGSGKRMVKEVWHRLQEKVSLPWGRRRRLRGRVNRAERSAAAVQICVQGWQTMPKTALAPLERPLSGDAR